MTWTRKQQAIVAVLPKISSCLSFFGSGWIVVEILTHRGYHGNDFTNTTTTKTRGNGGSLGPGGSTTTSTRFNIVGRFSKKGPFSGGGAGARAKRHHPYHRLLLVMCFFDLLESIGNFLSTWPIPAEASSYRIWAIGTRQTCATQGFILQLAVAVPIYNAFLAVYFMLVIHFQFTETTLVKYVEPTMHCIAILIATVTSISMVCMGYMNDANLWCWIAPYPTGCKDSITFGLPPGNDNPCTRGDYSWIFRWSFYFGPLWSSIIVATVSTFMAFCKVRKADQSSQRYKFPKSSSSLSSMSLKQQSTSANKFDSNSGSSSMILKQRQQQLMRQDLTSQQHKLKPKQILEEQLMSNKDDINQSPRQQDFTSSRIVVTSTNSSNDDNHNVSTSATKATHCIEGNDDVQADNLLGTCDKNPMNKKRQNVVMSPLTTRSSSHESIQLSSWKKDNEGEGNTDDTCVNVNNYNLKHIMEASSPTKTRSSILDFIRLPLVRSNSSPRRGKRMRTCENTFSPDRLNCSYVSQQAFDLSEMEAESDELLAGISRRGTFRSRYHLYYKHRRNDSASSNLSSQIYDGNGSSVSGLDYSGRGGSQREIQDDSSQDNCSVSSTRRRRSSIIIQRWIKQRREEQRMHKLYHERSVEVAQQAFFYLLAFYWTHIWSTTNRIIQQVTHGKFSIFPLIIIHSFCDPLQGTLNFLVYQRPRYLVVRKKHPQLGRWGAIKLVLQFSFLQYRVARQATSRFSSQESSRTLPQSSRKIQHEDNSIGSTRSQSLPNTTRDDVFDYPTCSDHKYKSNNNNNNNTIIDNDNNDMRDNIPPIEHRRSSSVRVTSLKLINVPFVIDEENTSDDDNDKVPDNSNHNTIKSSDEDDEDDNDKFFSSKHMEDVERYGNDCDECDNGDDSFVVIEDMSEKIHNDDEGNSIIKSSDIVLFSGSIEKDTNNH